MSLIHCPSCRNKMSSIAKVCAQCGFKFDKDANISDEEIQLFKKRKYRDSNYRLKMISYVAMSITMIGAIPMVWAYIKAIENGAEMNMAEHWGIYLVAFGFLMYLIIRVIMIQAKRAYRKSMQEH